MADTELMPDRHLDPAQQKIPSLDGIRGLAILLVLVVHTYYRGPDINPGKVLSATLEFGWSGVELFFVLSGYLITSILLRERSGRGALKKFWINRIARIFPLYFVLLFLLLFASYASVPEKIEESLRNFRSNFFIYFFFMSNFSELLALDIDGANKILGPVWSLAIEQQYYLVWPIIMVFATKNFARWALMMAYFCSFSFRLFIASPETATLVYHTTFLHPDGIIVGSLIALWRKELISISRYWPLIWLAILSCLLALFFVAGTTHYSDPNVQKYGYPLISSFYAISILCILGSGQLGRIFEGRILTLFGRYSYSIYLLHWPLLVGFDQIKLPAGAVSWLLFLVIFSGAMLFVGLLSWVALENPLSKKIRSAYNAK